MKACWGGGNPVGRESCLGRGKPSGRECLQSQHLEDEKTKVTAQVTLVTSISQQCSCCVSAWQEPGRSQGADRNLKLKRHKSLWVLWRDQG